MKMINTMMTRHKNDDDHDGISDGVNDMGDDDDDDDDGADPEIFAVAHRGHELLSSSNLASPIRSLDIHRRL